MFRLFQLYLGSHNPTCAGKLSLRHMGQYNRSVPTQYETKQGTNRSDLLEIYPIIIGKCKTNVLNVMN